MRQALLVIFLLVGVGSCGFYTDLLLSIFKSGKPSISTFVRGIPKDLLDTLEENEQQAGQFVCAVLEGHIPGAFENLGTGLASDVWVEIQTGFGEITSFIETLPTLAPAILDNIISDGEDAVSVMGELFANPGGALTVIEGDVMTVVSDVESVATGVWDGVTCFFCDCCTSGTTTSIDPLAILTSSCNDIMAAAITTYSPTDQVTAATSSTAYSSAQPTSVASPTLATQTSMTVQAAATTVTSSEEFPAQPTSQKVGATASTTLTTSEELPAESTSQKVGAGATTVVTSLQSTSTSSQTTHASGTGSTSVPSDGAPGFVLQAWVGLLACFIVFIVVL